MGVHSRGEKVKSEVPTGNEAVSVDAGEEAGQVLVVDEWSILSVEVPTFQELNELEHVAFGQVVGKSCWNELVDKFRYAIKHRSETGRVEADDGTTRPEVLLPFWQDVGIG